MASVLDKMMGLLGVRDEEEVEEFVVEEEDEAMEEPWNPSISTSRRESRQQRQREKSQKKRGNLISLQGGAQPQAHMVILEPEEFEEVRGFVDLLKNKRAIVVRLEKIDRGEAQRVVDFMCGATHALEGNMRKLGRDIFCFAPSSIVIEGDTEQDLFDLSKQS